MNVETGEGLDSFRSRLSDVISVKSSHNSEKLENQSLHSYLDELTSERKRLQRSQSKTKVTAGSAGTSSMNVAKKTVKSSKKKRDPKHKPFRPPLTGPIIIVPASRTENSDDENALSSATTSLGDIKAEIEKKKKGDREARSSAGKRRRPSERRGVKGKSKSKTPKGTTTIDETSRGANDQELKGVASSKATPKKVTSHKRKKSPGKAKERKLKDELGTFSRRKKENTRQEHEVKPKGKRKRPRSAVKPSSETGKIPPSPESIHDLDPPESQPDNFSLVDAGLGSDADAAAGGTASHLDDLSPGSKEFDHSSQRLLKLAPKMNNEVVEPEEFDGEELGNHSQEWSSDDPDMSYSYLPGGVMTMGFRSLTDLSAPGTRRDTPEPSLHGRMERLSDDDRDSSFEFDNSDDLGEAKRAFAAGGSLVELLHQSYVAREVARELERSKEATNSSSGQTPLQTQLSPTLQLSTSLSTFDRTLASATSHPNRTYEPILDDPTQVVEPESSLDRPSPDVTEPIAVVTEPPMNTPAFRFASQRLSVNQLASSSSSGNDRRRSSSNTTSASVSTRQISNTRNVRGSFNSSSISSLFPSSNASSTRSQLLTGSASSSEQRMETIPQDRSLDVAKMLHDLHQNEPTEILLERAAALIDGSETASNADIDVERERAEVEKTASEILIATKEALEQIEEESEDRSVIAESSQSREEERLQQEGLEPTHLPNRSAPATPHAPSSSRSAPFVQVHGPTYKNMSSISADVAGAVLDEDEAFSEGEIDIVKDALTGFQNPGATEEDPRQKSSQSHLDLLERDSDEFRVESEISDQANTGLPPPTQSAPLPTSGQKTRAKSQHDLVMDEIKEVSFDPGNDQQVSSLTMSNPILKDQKRASMKPMQENDDIEAQQAADVKKTPDAETTYRSTSQSPLQRFFLFFQKCFGALKDESYTAVSGSGAFGESGQNGSKVSARRRRVALCFVLGFIIFAVVVITTVLLLRPGSSSSRASTGSEGGGTLPPSPPTTAPTFAGNGLRVFISNISPDGGRTLSQPGTAQSKAFSFVSQPSVQVRSSPSQLAQKYALATLYFSTNGEEWFNNNERGNQWLDGNVSVCDWTFSGGDSSDPCDDLGYLTTLALANNGLRGSIPPEISMLTRLDTIELTGNSLSGVVPSELMDLNQLTSLSLAQNRLRGSIPTFLVELQRLEKLILSANKFDGTIPDFIASLGLLMNLQLASNELSSSIPERLGDLNNLRVLNLRDNELTGRIPDRVGGMNSLTELDLNSNQLSGSIPSQLGRIASLRALDIGSTKLSGSIPMQLWVGASNLDVLRISDTGIVGGIPSDLISLATNLRVLDLSKNDRFGGSIPSQIGSLTNLEELNLASSALTGTVPSNLGQCTKLRRIKLQDNDLVGSIPVQVSRLPLLVELTTRDNPNLQARIAAGTLRRQRGWIEPPS